MWILLYLFVRIERRDIKLLKAFFVFVGKLLFFLRKSIKSGFGFMEAIKKHLISSALQFISIKSYKLYLYTK